MPIAVSTGGQKDSFSGFPGFITCLINEKEAPYESLLGKPECHKTKKFCLMHAEENGGNTELKDF